MLDLPLLQGTFNDCGRKLPRTDNVGRSGDWNDLYYLTDYVTFALDQHYDSQPCGAGCSLCCKDNAVFRVTPAEWRVIEAYLDAAGPSWVEALLMRTRESFGGYFEQLQAVAAQWEAGGFDTPNPALDGLPTLCPALEDDNCGIYEARPLMCRAYGYFAANVRGKESLLICKTFGEPFIQGLRDQGLENVPLPNFEPFSRQLGTFDSSSTVKPLPLWLLEYDQRRAGA